MKILQSAERSFLNLGVDRQQLMKNHPFNCRNVFAILVLSLSVISCGTYLFRVANTFEEYTYSIYAFLTMLLPLTVLLIVVFNMQEYFDGLNAVEKTVNERKSSMFMRILQQ